MELLLLVVVGVGAIALVAGFIVVILAWLILGRRQARHREAPHEAAAPTTDETSRGWLREAIEEASPPAAATAADSPGFTPLSPQELAAHFPQLEIIELLGKGGMGAVYKARQPHLERLIALKVLPPDAARDSAFAERFAREARALARLNHPHIVTVHDFGESNGLFFLLMEFVDGVNLRQAMRAGHVTPQEAMRIVPQLCEALQFAHDEGVVHRDIKPENILLDKRGRVKVADFGLAKLLGQSAGDDGLTGTQQVMGTMNYMAPEQLAGARAVDHRADIYSLGVTFYEMLTRELPMGRFPPPSQTAGVDARLDAVVLRTLERAPGDRYQHARDVGTAFVAIAGDPSAAVVHSRPQSIPRPVDVVRDAIQNAGSMLVLTGTLNSAFSLLLAFFFIALASIDLSHSGIYFGLGIFFIQWTVVAGMFILSGGRALRRARSPALVLAGTVVALVPVTPVVLLAIPVGIWVLRLLRRQDVRDEFLRAEWLAKNRQFESSASRQRASGRPETAMHALGWIVGRVTRAAVWTRLLAIPLGICGAATLFMPWVYVQVDAHVQHQGRHSDGRWASFEVYGYELWQAWAACISFFFLASIALATVRQSAARWPGLVLLLGGAASGALAAAVLISMPVPGDNRPELNHAVQSLRFVFPDLLMRGAENDLQRLQAASREHNIVIQMHAGNLAGAGVLGLAAALVLLAVVDVSRAIQRAAVAPK